jgi:uncharacterized protein YndB with AHSA1/START domain
VPREFEVREEITLTATPEEVWDAIATGPGVDSWFMGRSEIQGGVGGRGRLTLAGVEQDSTVTAWEPGRRFAHRGDAAPDGSFMAFEYLIEARDQASTVLRLVHSGILADDWDAQYDSLRKGDSMYLRKLATYLAHFGGRTSTANLFARGPKITDRDRVWSALTGVAGLAPGPVAVGDTARITVHGLAPADGVVAFADGPRWLGVRTDDSIYMFVHGYSDSVVVEYHGFAPEIDAEETEKAWQYWLDKSFV